MQVIQRRKKQSMRTSILFCRFTKNFGPGLSSGAFREVRIRGSWCAFNDTIIALIAL